MRFRPAPTSMLERPLDNVIAGRPNSDAFDGPADPKSSSRCTPTSRTRATTCVRRLRLTKMTQLIRPHKARNPAIGVSRSARRDSTAVSSAGMRIQTVEPWPGLQRPKSDSRPRRRRAASWAARGASHSPCSVERRREPVRHADRAEPGGGRPEPSRPRRSGRAPPRAWRVRGRGAHAATARPRLAAALRAGRAPLHLVELVERERGIDRLGEAEADETDCPPPSRATPSGQHPSRERAPPRVPLALRG